MPVVDTACGPGDVDPSSTRVQGCSTSCSSDDSWSRTHGLFPEQLAIGHLMNLNRRQDGYRPGHLQVVIERIEERSEAGTSRIQLRRVTEPDKRELAVPRSSLEPLPDSSYTVNVDHDRDSTLCKVETDSGVLFLVLGPGALALIVGLIVYWLRQRRDQGKSE